jgi:WD40 repeat protein
MNFGYEHKLTGHQDTISLLYISYDFIPHRLISCSLDGQIIHWDLKKYQIILKTKISILTKEEIVCYFINEKLIFIGFSEGLVSSFGFDDGSVVNTYKGHTDQITAIKNYNLCLLSSSCDCSIRKWNIKTGVCEMVYQFSDPISDIIVKNTNLILGSWDRYIRIIDLEENSIVSEILVADKPIRCIWFDDNVLYAGGCDLILRSWNVLTSKSLEYKGMKSWAMGLRVFSQFLVGYSDDKFISVWDKSTSKLLEQFSGHIDGITCLEIYADFIYSGSFDQTILLWNIEEMKTRIKERAIMTKEDIDSRKIETFFRELNTNKKGKKNKKSKKKKKNPD